MLFKGLRLSRKMDRAKFKYCGVLSVNKKAMQLHGFSGLA